MAAGNQVGMNPSGENVETYPFTCDLTAPVGGGDVTYTNADIIALQAGGTFPVGEATVPAPSFRPRLAKQS